MEKFTNLVVFVILTVLVTLTHQQNKVPPGVNPSQYQQPPQQQQYQPPPPPPPQQVQYQQPIQSAIPQEVPIQHVQHQPPPPPPPGGHQQGHGQGHGHHGQPQLLNAANLAEEKEHMQEHLNVNIDTSKMTEQELQFHYFKMHDADNNNKLDGCELIKSLIHWHDEHNKDEPAPAEEDLMVNVDDVLEKSDIDGDGYIDWFEYATEQGLDPNEKMK